MGNNEKDKLFNAYLDGQLSAAEAASFDEMFSADEKARIEAEVKLEAGISGVLCDAPACPEHVWKRTQLMLDNQANPKRTSRYAPFTRMAVGAVAAMLIFVAGSFVLRSSSGDADLFTVSAATVEEFAAMAEVTGTHEELSDYLYANGLRLALDSAENVCADSPHMLRILGICRGDCDGIEVQQILLDCCNFPTKIIIAPADSAAATMMDIMKEAGKVQETRRIGAYYACVVGAHPSVDALAFLVEIH